MDRLVHLSRRTETRHPRDNPSSDESSTFHESTVGFARLAPFLYSVSTNRRISVNQQNSSNRRVTTNRRISINRRVSTNRKIASKLEKTGKLLRKFPFIWTVGSPPKISKSGAETGSKTLNFSHVLPSRIHSIKSVYSLAI